MVVRAVRAERAVVCDAPAAGKEPYSATVSSTPYTSPLAQTIAPRLLERFMRYVRIDTQSRRDRERSPSTAGQLDLGRMLVDELRELGLAGATLNEDGYVTATLPPRHATGEAVIGLIAHMDTSPDASGAGVEPLVHRDYGGGVIELPHGGTRLDPDTMPELRGKLGHDIVSSSGDTLLGADDKAGVAIVVSALAALTADPELPRPTLRICFTPDEEIGEGATLFDIDGFGARCAYTIDGSEIGELQDESFSALEATVTVEGIEVHPGQADGKLVNAVRIASRIIAALPTDHLAPEVTSGRDGYIHPYTLTGTAGRAQFRALIRDFDEERLSAHVALLERAVQEVAGADPRASVEVDVHRQYSNMRRYLDAVPEVLAAAEEAIRAEGIEPLRIPIRGGTDGSRLSEMGLPTPNLFTGGHEYHSVREWASLQDMAAAAAVVVHLAEVWARTG